MATAEGTQGKYLICSPNLSCSSYLYEYFKYFERFTGSHNQLPDMGPSSYPPPTGTYDEYVPKYMTYKTMIKIS